MISPKPEIEKSSLPQVSPPAFHRSQTCLEIQNYNLRKSYIYSFGGNIIIKELLLSARSPQIFLTCQTSCKFMWNVT
ncbi:MAG: hypothetical protein RMY29_002740 [Nostoc sp. CreGUA01]|nr:hypothetical protein [Nostoc sp. CreGUA01]